MHTPQILVSAVLCVSTVWLSTTAAYAQDCQISVCNFVVPPACRQWRNVNCDLRNDERKEIILIESSFPEYVQNIYISDVKYLEIRSNALKNLKAVHKIKFERVETLVIFENATVKNVLPQGVTVSITSVNNLQLHPRAFSGVPPRNFKIIISSVGNCHVKNSAFPAGSTLAYVRMENITSLTAEPGAFAASIGGLTLDKVTMEVCDANTFSGQSKNILLKMVTIQTIKTDCVTMNHGLEDMHMQSCRFQNIETLAFHGNLKHVVIENCKIGRIGKGGFSFKGTSVEMYQSTIDEFSSYAVNMTTGGSLALDGVTIADLRKHAFQQARITRISSTQIEKAENESLTFAQPDDAVINNIIFHQKCACNTEDYVKLVFGFSEAQLDFHEDLDKKTKDVISEVRCLSKKNIPTPIRDYQNSHCRDPSAIAMDYLPTNQQSSMAANTDTAMDADTEASASLGLNSVSSKDITSANSAFATVNYMNMDSPTTASEPPAILTKSYSNMVYTAKILVTKNYMTMMAKSFATRSYTTSYESLDYKTEKPIPKSSKVKKSTSAAATVMTSTTAKKPHATVESGEDEDAKMVFVLIGGAVGATLALAVSMSVALLVCHRRLRRLEAGMTPEAGGQIPRQSRPPATPPISAAYTYARRDYIPLNHYYEELLDNPPSATHRTAAPSSYTHRTAVSQDGSLTHLSQASLNTNRLYGADDSN